MDIFIIVLICLAAFHFIYQDVVLPTIHVRLRNKFFGLRDDLRMLKISGDPAAEEAAYPIIEEGINNFINELPSLTLSFHAELHALRNRDPELRARVKQRVAVLRDIQCEKLKKIFEDSNNVLTEAYLANMGGWFVYLVPIALVFAGFAQLSRLALSLIALPSTDAHQVMPSSKPVPA